ncbi:hypothetical protein L7H23_14735 [Sphingopyxis sp. BSN-002]|uniref:hypothetical protein n=1 Tax=Sphingopyxis sp. BSN-002 TaxID=2911495 RepID=UPI001EDA0F4D|nr:hypothetical protein [Sphingopyxis sp. BSN-002]UKK83811.1 hypothetical protein L7H23_14735 [Sphingopyxis sp. BSN-002]
MKQEILPPLPADPEAIDESAIDDLPEELDFTPVEQLTKRWSGVTAQKQRIFIAQLAATGAVSMAAKAIGHSTSALYQLRKRAGAESFAAAWDRAVEAGARRVADLLMEYAIYGVPETISKRGQVILERRRPNIRAMQHIAASRFPENFGSIAPVDGRPASAVPHAVRRLREKWRAEWEAERQAEMLDHARRASRQETDLDDRLRIIRTGYQRRISHDPVKRAAWDMLTGPGTDWDAVRREDAYAHPQKHEWNMFHPDMIVSLSAGAGNIDWEAEEGGDLSHPTPPPADYLPWPKGGDEDEIWFGQYDGNIVEGEAGETDPDSDRVTRGDMRMAAHALHDCAEAWQAARRPVLQLPHDFLADKSLSGGATGRDRDSARRRIERAIAELEREWNAAYSEESWAAWQAGRATAAKTDAANAAEADDTNQPQPEGEA